MLENKLNQQTINVRVLLYCLNEVIKFKCVTYVLRIDAIDIDILLPARSFAPLRYFEIVYSVIAHKEYTKLYEVYSNLLHRVNCLICSNEEFKGVKEESNGRPFLPYCQLQL